MAQLYNLARMTVSGTPGTGTITLGSAVSGHLSFSAAGVVDGETISYGIRDGANSEVGTGVYTASGTTLSRTPTKSTNSDAAISVTSAAEVFITARAEDLYVLLEKGTVAANATSLDFVISNYSEFRGLRFYFMHFLPAASAILWVRLSTNAGSSYDAGATDYRYAISCWRDANVSNNTASQGAAQFPSSGGDTADSTGDGLDCIINVMDFTTSRLQFLECIGTMQRGGGSHITWHFDGRRTLAQTTNAIRFLWSTGNFAAANAGRYAVFGLR